jgi:hypothetical protein
MAVSARHRLSTFKIVVNDAESGISRADTWAREIRAPQDALRLALEIASSFRLKLPDC